MRHVFETETAPRFVQSDNGKEFKNKKVADLYIEFNVTAINGRPRHPKSQGIVERANQALVRRLGKTLLASGSKRWIDILSRVKYGINIDVHRATKKRPLEAFRLLPVTSSRPSDLRARVEKGYALDFSTKDSSQGDYDVPKNVFEDLAESSNDESTGSLDSGAFMVSEEVHKRYLDSMNKQCQVHRRKYSVGDCVLLKLDHDSNPSNRRSALDGFWDSKVFKIKAVINETNVIIEDQKDHSLQAVATNRLKKDHSISVINQ
jgi:hypothetical protein